MTISRTPIKVPLIVPFPPESDVPPSMVAATASINNDKPPIDGTDIWTFETRKTAARPVQKPEKA